MSSTTYKDLLKQAVETEVMQAKNLLDVLQEDADLLYTNNKVSCLNTIREELNNTKSKLLWIKKLIANALLACESDNTESGETETTDSGESTSTETGSTETTETGTETTTTEGENGADSSSDTP